MEYHCKKCNKTTQFKKAQRISTNREAHTITHTIICKECEWKWWASTQMTKEQVMIHVTIPNIKKEKKRLAMLELKKKLKEK